MARRLPSLSGLSAFEAAARLMSFTAAAEELKLTQSAISQRIKTLEDYLGTPLFRRYPRRLELTAQGRQLAPAMHDVLDRMEFICGQVNSCAQRSVLSVRVDPSFSAKWLMPRISSFCQLWPNLRLQIFTTLEPAKLADKDPDIAICWGRVGDWPNMEVDHFINCDIFPVCHPSFCEGEFALRKIEDLRNHAVLRHSERDYWQPWLRVAGSPHLPLKIGIEYDDASTAVEAAVHGQGVCLTSAPLVESDLRAGRLVRPFSTVWSGGLAFFLVHRKERGNSAKAQAFRQWISEAATSSYQPSGLVDRPKVEAIPANQTKG